jgi:hypothetical protein
MPVVLDCVTVRLVGELEPIETLPLTTVPPDGSDCAAADCPKFSSDESTAMLAEQQNSSRILDAPAGDETSAHDVLQEPPRDSSKERIETSFLMVFPKQSRRT